MSDEVDRGEPQVCTRAPDSPRGWNRGEGMSKWEKDRFQVPSGKHHKPLASTNEMVDVGNVTIMHKLGSIIQRASASTAKDVLICIKKTA